MHRSRLTARSAVASLAACGLLATAGAASSSAQEGGVETLRFTASGVTVTALDHGPRGKSPGDLYVYEGALRQKGKRIGSIYGSNATIKVSGRREIVQGQLSYDFGGGDTIVVTGISVYPVDGENGFVVGEEVGRVVVGGTGIYSGARGTVTTTRQKNGVYKHVVRLYP
jgi:hypothetical protein